MGWSDVTYLWSQCDRHCVGQHVVLCVVKWWRFVALFERNLISWFKKMSVLSLSYWESAVYWRQNNKHFAELAPQNGGKQLIWRNYVTVTLCISLYIYCVKYWRYIRYAIVPALLGENHCRPTIGLVLVVARGKGRRRVCRVYVAKTMIMSRDTCTPRRLLINSPAGARSHAMKLHALIMDFDSKNCLLLPPCHANIMRFIFGTTRSWHIDFSKLKHFINDLKSIDE